MTTLIESCQISPATGECPEELTLPLTYFDIPWLHFHPIRRLIFYDLPCSKYDFLETHLPKLKQSLSLALKHYSPLAGQLFCPLNDKPQFRYVTGRDSLPLTIFESAGDYESLVEYGARDADQFYDYVAELPPVTNDNNIIPCVVAIQVTLFPMKGLCIGFTNHHCIGDASSIVSFLKAWASINKLQLQVDDPCFDRSLIKDPLGIGTIFWNQMKEIPLKSSTFPLPTNRVRATYVLNQAHIKKLKDLVLMIRPSLLYLSSFVVASAYVWTNLVKSGVVIDDKLLLLDDEHEYFIFTVDLRARLDPPLPSNYFGNCLAYGMAKIPHSELIGNQGFVLAAEATAEDIRNRVNNKDQVLKGAVNWVSDMKNLGSVSILAVSGSPKFDLYDAADFGWGRVRKLEAVSIDGENYSMSLSKSRDCEGGIEIGLSLQKDRMEAFAALFADGLK